MNGKRFFDKPTLHLVVAEDNPSWSNRIVLVLKRYLDQWILVRESPISGINQVDLSVHTCRSEESFLYSVRELSNKGMVYATIDLSMPRKEGEQIPVQEAGTAMINECLKLKEEGKQVEFCLVSGLDGILDRLYNESPPLRNQGIRLVYKTKMVSELETDKILMDVVSDIQRFVRRHLSFCTVELPGNRARVPVWFGNSDTMKELLIRADEIASAPGGGVYVLIADCAGYEADWVKLCCDLKGLPLEVFDINNIDTAWQPKWQAPIENPPPALLLRNISLVDNKDCDVASLLDDHRFFEKVEQGGCLVFFQFPFRKSNLDLAQLQHEKEVAVWKRCEAHIENHRRGFIDFPSYSTLEKCDVITRNIEFQIGEGYKIDDELRDIMVEFSWNKGDGLYQLRRLIHSAYEGFVSAGDGKVLTEEYFKNSPLAEELKSERAFEVRVRRLYRLLERRDLPENTQLGSEADQAVASLVVLRDLYDDLARLDELSDHLGWPQKPIPMAENYLTLHQARIFLDSLFDNPGSLRLLIDKLQLNVKKKSWKSYYPPLGTGKLAAVENIRFSWPFDRLPLHASVDAYLKQNGLDFLIHRQIDENLRRYADIKERWEEIEGKRIELNQELAQREKERSEAERYVRESHSHPVFLLLLPRTSEDERRSAFDAIWASFLIFNSFLALAENHYVFGDKLLSQRGLTKNIVTEVELGHMVSFLENYSRAVQDKEADGSIFHYWSDSWAERREPREALRDDRTERRVQRDALRLIAALAKTFLSSDELKNGWKKAEREKFEEVIDAAKEGRCSIGAILRFFGFLRNSQYKISRPDFDQAYGPALRDFMRRFVAAITGEYRLGLAGTDSIDLWRKDPGEQDEVGELAMGGGLWRGRLVVAREVVRNGNLVYEALFPIDELIRKRPKEDSIWAYNKGIWLNLSHQPGSKEAARLSADHEPWLPGKEALEACELWMSVTHE